MSTLNSYLRCTRAQFAFISETRCGNKLAEGRLKQMPLCNHVVVPSNGNSGGLWLMWGDDFRVLIREENKHLIVAEVTPKVHGEAWLLICVYGDPARRDNPMVWNSMEEHLRNWNLPACLVGDFNAISSPAEKHGGNSVFSTPNRSFKNWISAVGLIDMGHHGPAYTWLNKQPGGANISQRLDRALATMSWMLINPEAAVFHLPRFNSDHLPVLLRPNPKPVRRMPPFRCENWWTLREGFDQVCVLAVEKGGSDWNSTRRHFKREVRTWVAKDKSPDYMLRQVENEMLILNAAVPTEETVAKEVHLQRQHAEILLLQERFWHQRARVNWSSFGDSNSRFFHATAVARKRRNSIRAILMENGSWETDEKGIRKAFQQHFTQIYKGTDTVPISRVYPTALLQSLPKIPDLVHPSLTAHPTEAEVFRVLMSLGPDKAPGPDGFNAKVVQLNWAAFKKPIMAEVDEFFITGRMKSYIARSNLVLIPKHESAARVGEYRPISICNLIYKLISKLISTRLKPFISGCISQAQTAFVPGREISENIVLLREVLHSFSLSDYGNSEFCLKLDLSKAFDRMDWHYLRSILPLYGFPSKLVNWIMACVSSAEFSIVVNGRGDGYFRPKSGLRQGCALSPYLFILGMDLLSRGLDFMTHNGYLTGVKLAPTAPPLTNCLYADDLLLFGTATMAEAHNITALLQMFSSISGQQVGPEKSHIWYSKRVTVEEREAISLIFQVPLDSVCGKYLGAAIGTTKEAYDSLIQKVVSRLQSWKGRLLSQAGRLVLIKSVLTSLPLYHMATVSLPAGVIKEITGHVRRFFWGKWEEDRYMAYVAWSKITIPMEFGGLGVKDLGAMNDALVMKFLWKLAAGSDAQWVGILKAKYLPMSRLWHSKRTYRCSLFWRSIMRQREVLLPMISWEVGDGRLCEAFAQPWFENSLQFMPQNREHRNLLLRDLVLQETGQWDVQRLVDLFGFQSSIIVLSNVPSPREDAGRDRLRFKESSNGNFSVKGAYRKITSQAIQGITDADKSIWSRIWKGGDVQPRVRIHVWKLIHDGLPLGQILSHRIGKGDSQCATCGEVQEDVSHQLFTCPFARACWLAGPLALRSSVLSQGLMLTIKSLSPDLTDKQWGDFFNSMWALWRCRNDKAYSAIDPSFSRFQQYLQSITSEAQLAAASRASAVPCAAATTANTRAAETDFEIWVDGSWERAWLGGVGYVVYQGTTLLNYHSGAARVCTPVQAEAQALLQAVTYAISVGLCNCVFYSDCLSLVKWCTDLGPPTQADWSAFQICLNLWKVFKETDGFNLIHVPRSQTDLADQLAKLGRIQGWSYSGCTFPMFPPIVLH